uniref:Gamma-soluble NSF attachment protein n=1 Tax=Toxocara canis TaxID=6265 RepID=A0A183TZN7_TOXCA
LKTSIIKMKFKPDYDSAAVEYERAAVCYKNANELQMSRDMYLKAAEMHTANGNLFHCAKCNENAAMISKELGDSEGAMKYMELAADLYAESGSSDTSAMALSKAASFLETADPDKAIQIYNKALTMVQQTDRSRMAGEFLNRLTRLYLKLERYADAISAIDSEIDKYIEVKETGRVGQLTVALVLVQLAKGDSIAATKSFQNSFK